MEVPSLSRCRTCKSLVELHDLRQCTCGQGKHPPHYCFRNCRFCRLVDFSNANCKDPSGHATCYERHLPIEANPEDPHTPLSPLRKLYVDAVTYSEENKERQDKLHEDDRAAQWFTIKNISGGNVPRIHVTDRFRRLCSPGIIPCEYNSRQFPGFVAFIGDTGTGKSTLLRAMILMGYLETYGDQYLETKRPLEESIAGLRNALSQTAYGPVSKSGSAEHMTDPTSFGVHLYRDMAHPLGLEDNGGYRKDTPILFADCEGFRAGLTLTNAERSEAAMFTPNLIMDSPITAKSYGTDGKDGIDLFYARFLYTVSDVIVFIMSSDGEFFADMQRLAEWAASAIYRSVNHLAKKTLVIVRNKATANFEKFFESEELKDNLLSRLMGTDAMPLWHGSALLQSFIDEHNSKQNKDEHQIQDNHDLLRKFFADIKACNIPDTRTTSLNAAFRQYRDLRTQIVDASNRSQALRAKNWMQYNVPTLSHILNRAFEHFRTSDEPFDFFKAARNDNPNPASIADHISNFLRHLHSLDDFPPEMPAATIATCLATWATVRNFETVSDPDNIFQKDLKRHCQDGIECYRVRDQKCGGTVEKGGPCVNKRVTHKYEHCDEKGTISPGPFDESFALAPSTVNRVHNLFLRHYRYLCTSDDRIFALPTQKSVQAFREMQLQKYKSSWSLMRSNKTCFGCLRAVPDHMLECGHAFCEQCVRELGTPSEYFEYGWVLNACVLCQSTWQDGRNLFRLKPRCAGVRVLTLDGGGIRGMVEISLLEKLHTEIDIDIPLREFFDLIIGTSTGGIIALGLATLPEEKARNIRDLKQTFFQLASKAFEKKRGQLGWTSGMLMLLRIQDSVYPTSPLRLGLQRLFGDRNLFSSHQRNVRVAVTSAKDHGADRCLIANYNRPFHSDQVHDFEREDEVVKDMNLWEAALATASAPFYFRPFEKTETGKNYVDGALHANFPVPYALDEVYRIWKTPGDEAWKKPSLDVLLSVGTGQQEREIVIPVPLRIGGFEAICTTFFNNLDSHRQWLEFQRVHLDGGANLARKVHRLNARLEEPYVSLDNYQSMERIDRGIQADFKSGKFSSQMKELAGTLIASLFFFEPSANYLNQKGIVPGLADSIPGTIRCRLARGSHPLKHLVDKISSFAYKEIRNDAELADDNGWKHITFPDQQRFEVRSENKWLRVKIVISPLDPVKSRQVVAVTLKGASQRFPISGFPLEWHVLQARSLAK